LNQPATDHKRSFEDAVTGYEFVHGWFWKAGFTAKSKFNFEMYAGAYHGYDNTRANLNVVIGVPSIFDVYPRPNLPYIRIHWNLIYLGWANGSYNKYLAGYLVLTSPPSYSFTPTNPNIVEYNLVTSIPNNTVNLLYGYSDAWTTDWDQWASLHKDSWFQTVPASKVEYDVYHELEFHNYVIRLIRYLSGQYALWFTRESRGLLVNLDGEVDVETFKGKVGRKRGVVEKIRRYDSIYGSEMDKPVTSDDLTMLIPFKNLAKTWKTVVKYDYERDCLWVIYGDASWDGDKFGFSIESL
jgi:hypothetical protein